MTSTIYIRAIIAFLITISAAYYQRQTGPTYPIDIDMTWNGADISGEMLRTHGGEGDQPQELTVSDTSIHATLIYKRFKTNDNWIGMKMTRQGEKLIALLPHQPPAGKLEYFIQLNNDKQQTILPEYRSVVTRFKAAVPDLYLAPHIFFMFIGMFFSTWAGLEAAFNGKKMYLLTFWATGLLFIGGMILGPIVQKYAFGDLWTGIPFGFDLTDNKTLVAMIAWIIASVTSYRQKSARPWIIAAAVLLLIIYSIPHSVMGSELNYQTMEVKTGQ